MNQIQFDDVLTFDEWGIYLSSYSVSDAEPKESYIDVPFADGSLDLTEAVTGEVSYNDRHFEAVFTLKPPWSGWDRIVTEVRSFLNGRKRKIKVPDSPELHLRGRCKTSFKKDGVLGILTVEATCEPYMYKDYPTIESFVLDSSGEIDLLLANSRKWTLPMITTDKEITVKFENNSIAVNKGSHKFTNIVLKDGRNPMTIAGDEGTNIRIEYQEGVL